MKFTRAKAHLAAAGFCGVVSILVADYQGPFGSWMFLSGMWVGFALMTIRDEVEL